MNHQIAKKFHEIKKSLSKLTKGGYNPHFKNHYVTWDSLLEVLNPRFFEMGLDLRRRGVMDNGNFIVVLDLIDVTTGEDAQIARIEAPLVPGATPQQVGVAFTYFSRIALLGALNLPGAEADADGEPVVTTPSSAAAVKAAATPKKEEPKKEALPKISDLEGLL